MPEKSYKKKHMTSFQLIILGFAGVIFVGTVLLMLPFSSLEKVSTPFHEALFTATSAVCVTGLVVKDTGSYWSLAGQMIILALIQIGGLGVVTVAASVSLLSGKKISLMQRSTMQNAISAPKVGGIVRLTRFILKGTVLICRFFWWILGKRESGCQFFIQSLLFVMPALIFWGQLPVSFHR